MTRSGRTSWLYGIYLGSLGAVLVIAPRLPLDFIQFPSDDPYWPRSTGLLAIVVAYYAIMAGRANLTPVIRWSVYCRMVAFTFFTLAVVTGIAPPVIFAIGAIDLLTALWSWSALRTDGQVATGIGPQALRATK